MEKELKGREAGEKKREKNKRWIKGKLKKKDDKREKCCYSLALRY